MAGGRNRKSIRLKNYDYSQAGFYFITICTQNRLHLFGEIVDDAGEMIDEIWHETPIYYDGFKFINLLSFLTIFTALSKSP